MLETISLKKMLEQDWKSKGYTKNGIPIAFNDDFNLTFTESTISCDTIDLGKLWPVIVRYAHIDCALNYYFHRGDGLIFELKSISKEELIIDLLEKDFKSNSFITHQFQFIKKPD